MKVGEVKEKEEKLKKEYDRWMQQIQQNKNIQEKRRQI